MGSRGHSSALVFSLAAIAFALLAGVLIPLSSGRGSGSIEMKWTPHATATAVPNTVRPTFTRAPTATVAPIAAPMAAPTATASSIPSPTPAPPTAAPTPTPTVQLRARIPEGPVNLRAGPGTTFTVLATAKSGEQFDVTGRSDDGAWVQLCCVGSTRVWASADLAELPAAIETYPVVR